MEVSYKSETLSDNAVVDLILSTDNCRLTLIVTDDTQTLKRVSDTLLSNGCIVNPKRLEAINNGSRFIFLKTPSVEVSKMVILGYQITKCVFSKPPQQELLGICKSRMVRDGKSIVIFNK